MKPMLLGLAAAGATAVATLLASSASAEVVCNRAGECWHTDHRYHYNPSVGVVVHPDDWYFHQHWDDQHRWREHHEGRGYYREGVWIPF
jgi:hypothetical protein